MDTPDEQIDTLLVAGAPSKVEFTTDTIAGLQRRVPGVRRYGSVCTGIFLLAKAGLLNGRKVTTHWECANKLQAEHPELIVDVDKIFLQDGMLYTAAGVSAGIDLALALVEEDYGRNLALTVARYMVVFLKRPGGQSQFSAHLAAQMSRRTPIQRAQEYVLHWRQDFRLDVMLVFGVVELPYMDGRVPDVYSLRNQ